MADCSTTYAVLSTAYYQQFCQLLSFQQPVQQDQLLHIPQAVHTVTEHNHVFHNALMTVNNDVPMFQVAHLNCIYNQI